MKGSNQSNSSQGSGDSLNRRALRDEMKGLVQVIMVQQQFAVEEEFYMICPQLRNLRVIKVGIQMRSRHGTNLMKFSSQQKYIHSYTTQSSACSKCDLVIRDWNGLYSSCMCPVCWVSQGSHHFWMVNGQKQNPCRVLVAMNFGRPGWICICQHSFFGPVHTARTSRFCMLICVKARCKLCEYSHWPQCVPFSPVGRCASCVLCPILKSSHFVSGCGFDADKRSCWRCRYL